MHGPTSSVNINDYISLLIEILCGVPHGSVLVPLLCSIYFRPLYNIISTFPNIIYHIYADDIQLIIKIPFNSLNSNLKLLECVSEIINWLPRNDLLVGLPKYLESELLNISRLYRLNIPTNFPLVIIDDRVIGHSVSVRNLRVIFDSTLTFDAHISSIPTFDNFHRCRIGHIKMYYSKRITKLLINDLVLSRIDYWRSLFGELKNI